MSRLKIKNWKSHQHYKDRCPPWIKLHRSLLDDKAFMLLADASKLQLILIWLLASESDDGSVPADPKEIAWRLRRKNINLKPLIDAGFLVDADNVLADCKQVADPEREGERERETEKRQSYGEFGNVLLTEDEHSKLRDSYKDRLDDAIDVLDAYIEQKGKRYKNHYAVMRRGGWVWERVHEHRPKSIGEACTL